MMKKSLFLMMLCLPLLAQAVCEKGNVYEDIDCYEREIAKIKPKMNATYRELVKLNTHNAHKSFEQSQKLWLQFIEKDCEFENTPSTMAQGSGYGLGLLACKHERYTARLKQMQNIVRELREVK